MKKEEKEKTIRSVILTIPTVTLLVVIGTITNYDLVYTIPAAMLGYIIGLGILTLREKRK